jgi:hypothetical protein
MATTAWMFVVAIVVLCLAAYAQIRIPAHTAGAEKIAWARGILIIVGLALGYVGLRTYQEPFGPRAVLAFVIGFGLAHVPAAVILFLKRERGAGKS